MNWIVITTIVVIFMFLLWVASRQEEKSRNAKIREELDRKANIESTKKLLDELERMRTEVEEKYTTPKQRRRRELRQERAYYSKIYGEIAKYQHDGSRYVIFDLETTGLNSLRHSIIEIAAVRYIDDEPSGSFETLVRLPHNKKLPAVITELTGITTQLLDDAGLELEHAINDFIKFIGDDIIMSYNFEFDESFLHAACGRKLSNKSRCIYKMAKSKWKNRSSYKLVDLLESECMTNVTNAHRAMRDVENAHDLLITIAYY